MIIKILFLDKIRILISQIYHFLQRYHIVVYLIIYFIAINVVSIIRFYQFDIFYYDHGIFDQALWNIAHFQAPYIDHLGKQLILQIGDHFNPIYYLLAPLYWITSRYEILFIFQNFCVVSSAWVIYQIGKRHIDNKLMLSAIILGFTLFIGMQNSLISGFHAEWPALLMLSLTLWALDKEKWIMYVIFLILFLGLKEAFVGTGVGIGVYLLLTKRYTKGILTIIYSLIYYYFAIKIAIPYFTGQNYLYQNHHYANIWLTIQQFFTPYIKIETISVGFLTFGLLPLISLTFLPAIIQDYFVRFVMANSPARTDLGMHYNTIVTLLLAFGSIRGLKILLKYKWYRKIVNIHAILIIVLVLYFHQFKYHGALGLVYNRSFYTHTKNLNFLKDFITQIPTTGTLMTTNNLAVQLTHTHKPILLRQDYTKIMPDVIAIDFRKGQNPNNYWPLQESGINKMRQTLITDTHYKMTKISDDLIIWEKIK